MEMILLFLETVKKQNFVPYACMPDPLVIELRGKGIMGELQDPNNGMKMILHYSVSSTLGTAMALGHLSCGKMCSIYYLYSVT